MPTPPFRPPLRSVLALAVLGAACAVRAQDAAAAAATLAPVLVTGNPLAADALATPASVLTGTELVLRRGSTLGDTLGSLPGVSSSYFGPNANRPVIRGFDGDRIRVLNNAGASLDASSLSFDHAVPLDPLLVTRLEVLRGPAALLYGGSAVGGVVNAIDNRIPREPQPGVSGVAEARGGGAARERAAVGAVDAGGEGFALHADAFARRTDDLRTPDYKRPDGAGGFTRENRIINSTSEGRGGALGGSWVGSRGYLGLAWDSYRNDYGVVAEEDILIKMQRDKLALAGEYRFNDGFVRKISGRVQRTDYQHEEVEGTGEVGTTFENKGTDSRFELEHAAIGALKGVIGLQTEDSDFSALGDEAFVPSTGTRQFAGFVFEELGVGEAKISFGGRIERTTVDSAGDADPAEPKFGDPQSRRFTTGSAALGGLWPLAGGWQASANLAYTERAPTLYELYANGVHAATGTFERGSLDQHKERGSNLDLGLQWSTSPHSSVKASLFASDFSNYIALLATGEPDFIDADSGESFPVYAFQGVRARFVGGELEARWRLLDAGRTLDLDGQLDWVRADNRTSGEPLPRIAPLRAALGASWGFAEDWLLRGEVRHAARQSRVPSDDVATPSYTLLNLALSKSFGLGGAAGLAYLKLDNLTDELAFNASTIGTVRPLAPLGGRALSAGLRLSF
ncbi:TonB-dependent receptor [Rivibacter subsaxonicus]|uniref:Iron complex outermembrane receptor protein n=1 Tax=Rivibacter subsaxonicus TaxID=457575 RepID=A0A4Q7W049_9BURK|nr:TonB-dependent receptor [Rivibacter subsaxonicus]RZU02541.1 iron complex outermembrane receptor protein [Rivibacter subsaxonicus]